ncbi:hypothetical protein EDI_099760 [Entamoeba dispar SAW760]|uniref:Flavodoxin-like domain-containing protein n=1 Tax=Entamoeba dispar (strain ATCC PRA-260 / SAW760) TaxID=370354 RepID=B0ELC3_ENTDS|nr:uncharacterized protein EDI_099760 [Entamoeba dispar SAW760]EDR24671.1 hypothetical protein EDI_099760 [Entamoeba dispar SAW760]|eukprot:EDR24671.1 hypothetical protein EDI_099760 [Entamoeba dispar SAW760]
MTKPLIIYYSNIKSLSGEIAHKLALAVHGDIYEVKTPKLYYRSQLNRDGTNKISKIPIIYDALDFTPYNPIYIVGETSGKYVIGPIRSWMEQNKSILTGSEKEFVYCIFGRKPDRSIKSMKAILGQPRDIIMIDTFEYPLDLHTFLHPSLPTTKKNEPFKLKLQHFIHS